MGIEDRVATEKALESLHKKQLRKAANEMLEFIADDGTGARTALLSGKPRYCARLCIIKCLTTSAWFVILKSVLWKTGSQESKASTILRLPRQLAYLNCSSFLWSSSCQRYGTFIMRYFNCI